MHRMDHFISQRVTLDRQVLRPNAARQSHIKIHMSQLILEKRDDLEILSP